MAIEEKIKQAAQQGVWRRNYFEWDLMSVRLAVQEIMLNPK